MDVFTFQVGDLVAHKRTQWGGQVTKVDGEQVWVRWNLYATSKPYPPHRLVRVEGTN
ncbi:hypothetical protein PP304_gp149 [Gordonia phage Phendrix]|nr:hypothetical protein PP304_gp149 [Gordonia phage Phendrix]QDK02720.1 hypothetical protein SEA_PHENDRIX_204 [Gordonia phage Phendrix]